MTQQDADFVFAPLGGLGEIGMNAALYGYGPPRARKWILVDCGLGFPGPDLPGIEIVLPDLSAVEKLGRDLLAIVITHAHEDHIGALAALWPKLKCKVFATPFAAGLIEARRLSEPGAPNIGITLVKPGASLDLSPFHVEYIAVAHSIPEACALAIRTPAGLALHTGDWKIDETPGVGHRTDEARLRALGDEGVSALICNSTNILRDGQSFSESEVAAELRAVIAEARGRVIVTTFASNVQRVRAIAEAAASAGRSVVAAGRALDRTIEVARELGYLDGVAPFYSLEHLAALPRDRTVILATGSQGEARAALARAAAGDHPAIKIAAGDRVIFSSRAIPGNQREVQRLINKLCDLGAEIVTDHDRHVHCSGHPRRGEVARLYGWVRPKVAAPAHGESHHLARHAAFAREHGVDQVVSPRDGDVVRLAPGAPAIIGKIAAGRLFKDGEVLIGENDGAVRERVKLAFAGVVSIALCVSRQGEMIGDPDVVASGLPKRGRSGAEMGGVIDEAVFDCFEALPRPRRKDFNSLATAIERSVRGAVFSAWGKKPTVHVLIVGG